MIAQDDTKIALNTTGSLNITSSTPSSSPDFVAELFTSMEAMQFPRNLPQSDATDLKRTEVQKNYDLFPSDSEILFPEVIAEKKSRLEAFTFSSVKKNSEGFKFRTNSSQNTPFSTCFIFGQKLEVPPKPASPALSSCSKNAPPADEESDITTKKSSTEETFNDKATKVDDSVHISNTLKQSENATVPAILDTNLTTSQPSSCNIFTEFSDSLHRSRSLSNPVQSGAVRKRSGSPKTNTFPTVSSLHDSNDELTSSQNIWTMSGSCQQLPKLVKPLKSLNTFPYKERSSAKIKSQVKTSTKAFPFDDTMAKTVPGHFNFYSHTSRSSPLTSCFIFGDETFPSSLSANPESSATLGNILAVSNQASCFTPPPEPGLAARRSLPSKNHALPLDFKPSVKTENTTSLTIKGLLIERYLGLKPINEPSYDAAMGKQLGHITRNPSPADTIRDNTMFAELSEDLSNSRKILKSSKKQARLEASSCANYTMRSSFSVNKQRGIVKSPTNTLRDDTMFAELTKLNLNSKKELNTSTETSLELKKISNCHDCASTSTVPSPPFSDLVSNLCNSMEALRFSKNSSQSSVTSLEKDAASLEKCSAGLEKGAASFEKDAPSLEKYPAGLEKGAASLEKSADLKSNKFSPLSKQSSASSLEKDAASLEKYPTGLEKGAARLQRTVPRSNKFPLSKDALDFKARREAYDTEYKKTGKWGNIFSFAKPSLEFAQKRKTHPSFNFARETNISEGFNFGTQLSLNKASNLCFMFTASANEPTIRKSTKISHRRINNRKSFSSSSKKDILPLANQASTSASSTNIKTTLASTVESIRTKPTIEHQTLRTGLPFSRGEKILSDAVNEWARNIATATRRTKEQQRKTTIPTNQNPPFEFSRSVSMSDTLHQSNRPSNQQNPTVLSTNSVESNENRFSLKDAIANVPMLLALEMELNEEQVRKAIEKYTKKYKKQCYTLSELADAVLEDGTSLRSNHETSVEIQPPNSIEQEIRKLKEDRMCKICMENEVEMLYYPCGHLVACERCAIAVTLCPICRSYIKKHIRAFL